MKRLKQLKWAGVLGVCLLAWNCPAQVLTNAAPKILPERLGRILEPLTVSSLAEPVVVRPSTPERPMLDDDIKVRLQRFELLREKYLADERELKRRLRAATDDQDRQRIRESIKERREAWLDLARSFREQARERLVDLKDMLPQHREVLDAARESAQQGGQSLLNSAHSRRGAEGGP